MSRLRQMKVKIKKLLPNAQIPTYGSAGAAGSDLYAVLETPLVIKPHQTQSIHTGIALEIPTGLVGLVFARSGLSCKQDLAPATKVSVIDSDYRGELVVVLHNHGEQERTIQNGDRIAQLVFMPYIRANYLESETLSETARGTGGFGHTGR